MWRSWKIGRAFGIDLYLHWSVLLLFGIAVLSNPVAGSVGQFLLPAVLLTALLGCVILHELGHALMARYFGIGTRDITLYLIGGVARLDRLPRKPSEEILIALAGPAVNLVIVVFLLPLVAASLLPLGPATLDAVLSDPLGKLVLGLWFMNLLLAGFNLLPAFPMDGGRILRALLSLGMGHLRATEVAVRVSGLLALLFALWGLVTLDFIKVLLAGFVWTLGRMELFAVRQQEFQRRFAPLDVVPVEIDIPTVEPVAGPQGFSGVVWDDRYHRWVVWHNGRPISSFAE